jgi:tRNA threonylcarbamoyladenosine biosynthesis protein TsaE
MSVVRHVTLHELDVVAASFVDIFHGGDIVLLVGEMGTGKTTFVSHFARCFHVADEVTSPTFSIVNLHDITPAHNGAVQLVHVDTYRLTHLNELFDLGIENLFASTSITMIEWGERIEGLITEDHFRLEFTDSDTESRDITLRFIGDPTRESDIETQLISRGWARP